VYSSLNEAIAAATHPEDEQSTPIDRSSPVDRCRSSQAGSHRSTPGKEPIYSSQCPSLLQSNSISSLNLFSSSQGAAPEANPGATQGPANIPVGGADAPQAPVASLKGIVWKEGIASLVSAYNGSVSEKEIRSRLGLLIKQHGQGLVLDAIVKAETAQAIDPLD